MPFFVMLMRCHSRLTFVYVISLWETWFHYTLFPLKSEPIDSIKWELAVFWFTCACMPVKLMTRNDDDMSASMHTFFVGTALFISIYYYFYWITCTLSNLKDARDSRESVQQCVVFATYLPKQCIIKSVDLGQHKGEIWGVHLAFILTGNFLKWSGTSFQMFNSCKHFLLHYWVVFICSLLHLKVFLKDSFVALICEAINIQSITWQKYFHSVCRYLWISAKEFFTCKFKTYI